MKNSGIQNKDIEPDENKDAEYDPKDDTPSSKGGRKREANFDALGTKMQRKRLKSSLGAVKQDGQENNLTPIKTVAKLGEMIANESNDRETAKMFSLIAKEENPLAHRTMDVVDATALKVSIWYFEYRVSILYLSKSCSI